MVYELNLFCLYKDILLFSPASEEVTQPIVHPPMPPQKKRKAPRPHIVQPPQSKSWEGIPEDVSIEIT